MSNSRDFLKGLIIGGLIGAAAGILFAPKSGKETREDISRKTQDLLSRAKEEYETAMEKSKKAYEAAMDKMKEVQRLARTKAAETGEKIEELAEKGMETLDDTRGRFKKAIDAGIEAFKEEKEKT